MRVLWVPLRLAGSLVSCEASDDILVLRITNNICVRVSVCAVCACACVCVVATELFDRYQQNYAHRFIGAKPR